MATTRATSPANATQRQLPAPEDIDEDDITATIDDCQLKVSGPNPGQRRSIPSFGDVRVPGGVVGRTHRPCEIDTIA